MIFRINFDDLFKLFSMIFKTCLDFFIQYRFAVAAGPEQLSGSGRVAAAVECSQQEHRIAGTYSWWCVRAGRLDGSICGSGSKIEQNHLAKSQRRSGNTHVCDRQ